MESFDDIYARAVVRRGGEQELEALLPEPKSARQLAMTGDDRYLAMMTRCVFRSGFVWKVVAAKWDGFEEAFLGFDPSKVAALSDRDLQELGTDTRIIRNLKKIQGVRDNATFLVDMAEETAGFGRFLADWPSTEIVDLWQHLKEGGQRLGGDTGPMFLREVGKDSFLLTRDVVAYLVNEGVVAKKPGGKRDRQLVQDAFNEWAQQSGRRLCQISRVVACSYGEIR